MIKKLYPNKQDYLSQFMNKHEITSNELAEFLDKGVEMLFYLEEDTFDRKDVQNVVFAMKGVIGVLRKGE